MTYSTNNLDTLVEFVLKTAHILISMIPKILSSQTCIVKFRQVEN